MRAAEEAIELRAWQPGDERPEEPAVTSPNPRHAFGTVALVYQDHVPDRRPATLYEVRVTSREPGPSPIPFRRGDTDADGMITIADPIHMLQWLFIDGPAPVCEKTADGNGNGSIELGDAVFLLDWLFAGGAAPSAPTPPGCGEGETPDDIPCERHDPACP